MHTVTFKNRAFDNLLMLIIYFLVLDANSNEEGENYIEDIERNIIDKLLL